MDNVEGLRESVLVVFGGLVVEVDDTDLPAGSAAICTDFDFTVASAQTRDGVQNVYSYEGSFDLGVASVGISVSAGPNETAWLNPSNIITNTPGTYASVITSGPQGSGPTPALDQVATNIGTGTAISVGPVTPTSIGTEWAVFVGNCYSGLIAAPGGSWSIFPNSLVHGSFIAGQTFTGPISGASTCASSIAWDAALLTFFTSAPPVIEQTIGFFSGGFSGTRTFTAGTATTAGNDILFFVTNSNASGVPLTVTLSDSQLNVYTLIASVQSAPNTEILVYMASNIIGGADVITWNAGNSNGFVGAYEIANLSAPPGNPVSQLLEASAFGMSIPPSSEITGVEVIVNGKQTSDDPSAVLTLVPLTVNNAATLPTRTFQLPTSDGSVTLGLPTDQWGQFWSNAQVENPSFGFAIQASSAVQESFKISGVELKVWFTPPGAHNFDYVKSFEQTDGTTLTLALDDGGNFWQEDVFNNPGVLTPFYTAIEPDTWAVSVTLDDREFIALSDRSMGTDMPRQYNAQWLDRVSQVGPGAGPTCSATSVGNTILTITQPTAKSDPSNPGNLSNVLWSTGPNNTTPGNIMTVYYAQLSAQPNPDPDLQPGVTVVVAGTETINGQATAGTYTVLTTGQGIVPGGFNQRWYFTVQMPSTQFGRLQGGHLEGTYQVTTATLTAAAQVPGLQVGGQMTISGSSVPGYDNTWTVLATPNASQLAITDTQLSGNVATYAFTITSGATPTVGQAVTVTGTTNGDGIFNVSNSIITSVSPGVFSLQIVAPDVPAAPESGNAIINGTIFQFDPMEVLGNATGGSINTAGALGSGTRGAVVMFLTRNGYLTAPSPQTIFTINENAASLVVTNLPIGPPNVVARVIALTGAGGATQSGGGGFYFWIPQQVTTVADGQTVTYDATIVNDNVTTQVTLNITDAILLAGLSISSQGSNNFAQIELGSCLGFVSYGERLIAWGEQNKIQNLLNPTFDGGVGRSAGTVSPLGWTIDPVNGAGVSVVNSPLFGQAFDIKNTSGSTQAIYGMITQPAWRDQLGTPIVESATAYSIRVTAATPSASVAGNLVVDLYSPSTTTIWGSFTIPLASMTTEQAIFIGNLLTSPFTIVPPDLLIRIYATALPNNGEILVDRIEPFPTNLPVLSTQMRASYFDNFEAFDGVTGNLGATQNQQPIRNAFTLFDNLYIVKTKSFYSTLDNGITEPNQWNVREVSNKVGTPSIWGVNVGEGWALIVGEAGLYLFSGGDPVKISPELDGEPGLWQSISWKYGETVWLRNDTERRKIYIGVPLPTPNKWMPKFPVNPNPTEPNVVLVCNYKELMTASSLQGEGPIRLTYTGELKTMALGRKWSVWSMTAGYADFIDRNDNSTPLFFCGDANTYKIYQQISGSHNDDGQAMRCQYVTYPFPKSSEAQQEQMGLHELLAHFMSLTVRGSGNLRITMYPNTLDSPNQISLDPETLYDPPAYGDTEVPLNMEGDRFFAGLEVTAVNEWFKISRIVMALGANPWAPVRGSN